MKQKRPKEPSRLRCVCGHQRYTHNDSGRCTFVKMISDFGFGAMEEICECNQFRPSLANMDDFYGTVIT